MFLEELEQLQKLRDAGTLSEEEFYNAKQRLLQSPEPDPAPYVMPGVQQQHTAEKIHGLEEKTWCMLMHLSQLLIFAGGDWGRCPDRDVGH